MRGLPIRAQGFILCLLFAGACIGGVASAQVLHVMQITPWTINDWLQTLCIISFVALLSHYRTPLPAHNLKGAVQSMGSAGHMAALIIFPLPLAVMISAGGLLLQHIIDRRPLVKTAFNASMNLLTVAVSGSVLVILGGTADILQADQVKLLGLIAICLTSIVYYCVHVPLYAVFFAYLNGRRVEYTFRVNYRTSVIPEMVSIFIGVIAGFLWRYSPTLILLIAMPVIITHVSFQSIRRLEGETIEAVKALADSIDVRDPYTAQHSVRVAALAFRLAEALALPDDMAEQINLAAQVHDLGKMTVPVEILGKQTALTPEERAIMEQHPVTGATVLSRYKGFGSSIPIVLHHHEHWDGHGYPDGLVGSDIPLGAQIIALADTFDAMTSDRPYRKGMAPTKALNIIKTEEGAQFDPILTLRFVQMLASDYPDAVTESGVKTNGTTPSGPSQSKMAATTAATSVPAPITALASERTLPLTVHGLFPASGAAILTPPSGTSSNET